jgi:hypothetical protein
MDSTNGGPAFPVPNIIVPTPGQWTTIPESHAGMSLRDWFAGRAMAAFITNPTEGTFDKIGERALRWNIQKLSGAAYSMADAMLAARLSPSPDEPGKDEKKI